MLQNLHVRNLALIQEAEVDFSTGLNIMTGETGAGKSIIIGSMNLALGEKIPKDIVRDEEKPGVVELVFQLDNEEQRKQLEALDIVPEDDCIILSRKIQNGRSSARVNSETVPVSVLKEVASIFIDIYGQQEHQTLLKKEKHLEFLDSFAGAELNQELIKCKELYSQYVQISKELKSNQIDEESKNRELELLNHEVVEINNASLKPKEDEELEERYRIMNGSKKVAVSINRASQFLNADEGALDLIGRASRELSGVCDFDDKTTEIYQTLSQLEDLASDVSHDISRYLDSLNFSEEEFYEVENRLDFINRLKDKYHVNSIEEIFQVMDEKSKRIADLQDLEHFLAQLQQKYRELEDQLHQQCDVITSIRKKNAAALTFKVTQSLIDLNFLDVRFDMQFQKRTSPTANGDDEAWFMISVNPGEKLKPLDEVASGGELSRIMLALKSVLAEHEKTATLIFDEIDTGISGRTAQMVAEKMNDIGRSTQVIAISHLPQIAAMADTHFMIEKGVMEETTISRIHVLSEEESIEELARMLGGVTITDAVLQNAREMKELAKTQKRH